MAKLNVSKWQAARRGPSYDATMQFYLRQIRMALFEALRVAGVPCHYGEPMTMTTLDIRDEVTRFVELWDAAIMARDWIARPGPTPSVDREGWVLSFDGACEALGLDADTERLWMLDKIDAAADFDTDEVYARIAWLTANPPDVSEEPLFDAPRVCPELDQQSMFALFESAA